MAEAHDHAEHDPAHGPAHDDPFHAHPTRELNVDDFDAANRSLAEALRISFGLLKFVVIALLIGFLARGSYNEVKQGQVGIVLRFGAPRGAWVGEAGDRRFVARVLGPGAHFALPRPIERVVIVPTSTQSLAIEQAFWFEQTPRERDKPLAEQRAPVGGLQPGRDGSLLTADKNIVHSRWSANWRVKPDEATEFAMNIGSTDVKDSLRRGAAVVRHAVTSAIVHVVASTDVDRFVVSDIDRRRIRALAGDKLDAMNAGIEVTDVFVNTPTPPVGQVLRAFNAVTNAQSDKAQRIEEARQEQQRILTETAGRGYPALLEAIDAYERARALEDAEAIERTSARIDRMLASPEALLAHEIGGEVAERIKSAAADRTHLVASIQSEAEAFSSQYNKFRDDPMLERIIRDRLRQDTLQRMFTRAGVETFWLPVDVDELYIELGRDPEVRGERETRARRRDIEPSADDGQ